MAEIIQKVQGTVGVGLVPVKVGTKLSTGVKVKEHSVVEANVDLDNLPGKVIIVGVPGAMTPTCSSQVPGYIKSVAEIKAKGISGVYVVSVNDQFVTEAWKEKLGGAEEPFVHFIADDAGKWTTAIGMAFDATGLLGNYRSHRYAMLVEDGVIKALEQETDDGSSTVTKADAFLAKL